MKVGRGSEDTAVASDTMLDAASVAELASSLRTDWASAWTEPAKRAAAERAAVAWKRMMNEQDRTRQGQLRDSKSKVAVRRCFQSLMN